MPRDTADYAAAYTDMVTQALKERSEARAIFAGGSMTPTLKEGMQILIEAALPEEIKRADIIMYRKTDHTIVHRVVGIIGLGKERIFVTKGDNHAYIDSDHIPAGDLVGRVSAAYLELGPETDVLVKNRAVGASYVFLANLASLIMHSRRYIPKPARNVLKYFVGAFFFLFKKIIHAVYMGIYYVRLLGRRDTAAF